MDDPSIIVHGMSIDAKDLMKNWPTRQAFADDVGQPVETVHKWAQNNRFPAWHHLSVLDACKARGIEMDARHLIEMSAAARKSRTEGGAR